MTFTCVCKKTTEYEASSQCFNIGTAERATKWVYIMLTDGGSMWLCGDCFQKACGLAGELFDFLGTDYLYFPAFVRDKRSEGVNNENI